MQNISKYPYPYIRLSSFYFFYFAVVGAVVPYWGVYIKSLGYDSQSVGFMMSAIFATRMIAPNFWGWIADKTQKRIFIIRLGSAIAVLFYLGVFISHEYTWLLLVVCCYSFFWHAVLPQYEVVTLRTLGSHTQDYSKIRLWGSVGFIVAVVGLGRLFDWISINYLPAAIFTFLVLILISSFNFSELAPSSSHHHEKGFLHALSHPLLLSFFVVNFLLQVSHGTYNTFYSIYLMDHYHYSRTATGLLWALGVLSETLMFVFMPRLLTQFSFRYLLLFSFLITAFRWMVIAYLADSLVVLLFAQLLHAFTFTVAHAVSIEVIRTHFNPIHQGRAQALYSSMSFGAGGALGAFISAFVWDTSTNWSFLISTFAAILGFIIAYFGLHFKQNPHVLSR